MRFSEPGERIDTMLKQFHQVAKGLPRRMARFAYVNLLPDALFDTQLPLADVKSLFSDFVKLVEIENHGYCNRTCWFCPNSFIDRRSEINLTDESVFAKILDDLQSIDYAETLVWARYHEPLAVESIYGNITMARRRLAKAFLTLHTNGDYLNPESIKKLEQTGLDQLRINLYVPNGQPYSRREAESMVHKLALRTELPVQGDLNGNGGLSLGNSRLDLPINVPNFSRQGMSTRGGSLLNALPVVPPPRTSVCFSPIQHVNIDWNGKGMLCCHVRSDCVDHSHAVIEDLSQPGYGLFDLYRDLAAARAALVRGGPKEGVCATCTMNPGGPDRIGRFAWVARAIGSVPSVERTVRRLSRARRRRYDRAI